MSLTLNVTNITDIYIADTQKRLAPHFDKSSILSTMSNMKLSLTKPLFSLQIHKRDMSFALIGAAGYQQGPTSRWCN